MGLTRVRCQTTINPHGAVTPPPEARNMESGFKKLHQFGAVIAAGPDTCIRQSKELQEPVERSMRRAMEEVLPYV